MWTKMILNLMVYPCIFIICILFPRDNLLEYLSFRNLEVKYIWEGGNILYPRCCLYWRKKWGQISNWFDGSDFLTSQVKGRRKETPSLFYGVSFHLPFFFPFTCDIKKLDPSNQFEICPHFFANKDSINLRSYAVMAVSIWTSQWSGQIKYYQLDRLQFWNINGVLEINIIF